MNVSHLMAQFAKDLTFAQIPQDVVHQTKRLLLDTLGCMLGAYESRSSQILLGLAHEPGVAGEATVVGGRSASAGDAALINGAMLRYLDYNDTAFIIQGESYRTGYHPSEVIPAILALGERVGASGQDVICAINIGYDLSLAFLEGVRGVPMEKRGWNGDSRGALIMPVVSGKLLGLSVEQMANAVGIAGACHAVFGILDTPAEEYTMTKNIRFPMMARAGILAADLARAGFTGPTSIIEGHDGFATAVMQGDFDTEYLTSLKDKFCIRETCIKSIIADFSSHGHLTATLNLAREHDIQADQVEKVIITTSKRCAEHTGDPVKKYPTNKETADHSSYYLTAIALLERQIGPAQFTPEKYADPKVRALIDRVVLQGDPSLDRYRPAGISEVITKDGKRYTQRVDHPRGHARNPMRDAEIVDKFRELARDVLSEENIQCLINRVFELEALGNISELMQQLTFEQPTS